MTNGNAQQTLNKQNEPWLIAAQQTLNKQNEPWLIAVLVANAVVFYLVIKSDSLLITGFGALFKEWEAALATAGLGAIIVRLLTGQLDEIARSRLVFWRWSHPLPGCRAFTQYGLNDDRYTMDAVRQINGQALPTEPQQQNARWYAFYAQVWNQAIVQEAHRNYLFYRDYATMSILLIIAFGGSSFWFIPSRATAAVYMLVLVAQYLLARQAARNYGIRLVRDVLAKTVMRMRML
jgi:hypothetical protein